MFKIVFNLKYKFTFMNTDNDMSGSQTHEKRSILQNAFDRLKCLSPKKTPSEQDNHKNTTISSFHNHNKENEEHYEVCENYEFLRKEIDDLKVQLIESQNMLDCFKKQKKLKRDNMYAKT